ncbi:hypothetical protein H9661_12795 [Clostridium sp. Sa3CVN1]|uniref:Thoeris anti-defense 2-like domain-containing protein n=1 Tax=Clostridium cibarium TaxID=2762247 RepID=A0ABR8PVR4_9CLOT|nr:hypothetical protein [Clostridium cibarium]
MEILRFDEAFKELIDNKRTISRKAWLPSWDISYDEENKEIIYFDGHGSQRWCPSHEDIVSTDWQIV